MFDHDSHYMYLIDAAWEAVEQAAAQPGSNGTSMADSGTCLANNGADSEVRGEGGRERQEWWGGVAGNRSARALL